MYLSGRATSVPEGSSLLPERAAIPLFIPTAPPVPPVSADEVTCVTCAPAPVVPLVMCIGRTSGTGLGTYGDTKKVSTTAVSGAFTAPATGTYLVFAHPGTYGQTGPGLGYGLRGGAGRRRDGDTAEVAPAARSPCRSAPPPSAGC